MEKSRHQLMGERSRLTIYFDTFNKEQTSESLSYCAPDTILLVHVVFARF